MKHLLDIKSLSNDEINQIYFRANEFEKGIRKSNHLNAHIVNMFFENSIFAQIHLQYQKGKKFLTR